MALQEYQLFENEMRLEGRMLFGHICIFLVEIRVEKYLGLVLIPTICKQFNLGKMLSFLLGSVSLSEIWD